MPPSLDDLAFERELTKFKRATFGLIEPKPGRIHFSLSASQAAETRAAPGAVPSTPPASGAATAFDLDACFTMPVPLDLDEGKAA